MEATKVRVGRKEKERVRFGFFVGGGRGGGVRVEELLVWLVGWLDLVGLDCFDGIPREREREKGEAYNPIDMDSLRASNGRSSSEPDGTYGKVV